jgi:hypothetical protein
MRHALTRHPATPCAAVEAIVAEVERGDGGRLVVRFHLTGRIEALVLPALAGPQRTDELWRHTCFEAFVRPGSGGPYLEFNLAPSGRWAAYAFDGYRAGMRNAEDVAAPGIELTQTPESLCLSATLSGLPPDAPLRLGLSAVIEEAGGRISYWALAHPPGRPDFHAADCFALELPAPLRP